jgi:hypothetical protein
LIRVRDSSLSGSNGIQLFHAFIVLFGWRLSRLRRVIALYFKFMTEQERSKIEVLDKCDFTKVFDYFKMKTEERKAMTKEEKKALKEENQKVKDEFGFCMWDGHKQPIGNYKIEPPGLFRGRGEHPKMGMVKKRTQPEDVIINCGSYGFFYCFDFVTRFAIS